MDFIGGIDLALWPILSPNTRTNASLLILIMNTINLGFIPHISTKQKWNDVVHHTMTRGTEPGVWVPTIENKFICIW